MDKKEFETRFLNGVKHNIELALGCDYIVRMNCETRFNPAQAHLYIEIYDSKPLYNIKHNSPVRMSFHGWVPVNGDSYDDSNLSLELGEFSYHLRDAGVKFRKIRAKNLQELKEKFLRFIRENKHKMDDKLAAYRDFNSNRISG